MNRREFITLLAAPRPRSGRGGPNRTAAGREALGGKGIRNLPSEKKAPQSRG